MIVLMGLAALVLLSGLRTTPPDAWRGDLLMLAAALCMAFYSVGSRPLIRRSGPLTFTALAMAVGALCLTGIAWQGGSFAPVASFGTAQWLAIAYLGVFGGAIVFFLWAFALGRTTPTRVAISVTVNPVASLCDCAVCVSVFCSSPVEGCVDAFYYLCYLCGAFDGMRASKHLERRLWLGVWRWPDPDH